MRHIPNILSATRIALVPVFIVLVLNDNLLGAGIVLAFSGLTDLFDGKLARHFGWVSDLGKVLDPVADKLTQATVCVMLALWLHQYWYFFVIMLVKDLVILLVGGHLLHKGMRFEGSRWFGKVSTAAFYITAVVIVLFPGLPQWLVFTLLCLTTLCAVVSGLLYIPEYRRYRASLEKPRREDEGRLP